MITVLIVVSLLAILLVSFTRIHQQNFGLLKNDLHEQAAQQGARSVFHYCQYRLEQDRSWGAIPFEGVQVPSVAESLEIAEEEGTHKLAGRVRETDTQFEIEVLNNIDGEAMVDRVERGFCRLRISTKRGTAVIRREALLKTAPLFDASVVASENIVIEAKSLNVASTDPFRNRLRARRQIKVPSYKNNSFRFTSPKNATEKGVLWAKRGILSGNIDLRDPESQSEAARMTGGRFVPRAETPYDIYDLQLSEIKASETTTTIPSGVYVFNRRKVEYYGARGLEVKEIPVLERRDSALDKSGKLKSGDLREIWYLTSSLPENARRRVDLFGSDVPQDGIHPKDTNRFNLEKGVEVKFNSVDPDFSGIERPPEILVNSNHNLSVKGDFGVTSFNPKYFPTLKFWDRATSEVGTDDKGELISGSITTQAHNGRPGSIFIAGRILGNAKLLAEGDVTIRNTFADVSADKLSDLSIYAGGSVVIRPQEARKLDSNTVFQNGGDGTTRFRGLIFARDDVLIEADLKSREDREKKGDVFIEGAVVSRSGSVKVNKAANIEFKYNPEYLDSILKPKHESRVRLEQVVWKEI